MSHVERKLFADIVAGQRATGLKSEYLKDFQITARQFNACRIQLEGKIASVNKRLSEQTVTLKNRIKSLAKHVRNLLRKKDRAFEYHHKKRKLYRLEQKLERLQRDQAEGKVRICCGSKKLFHAQYHLEENSFQSHEEWKKQWQEERDSSFFSLGSKDEHAGNQTCTAFLQEDGTFNLRLRLPDALISKTGKYVTVSKFCFDYGKEEIKKALLDGKAINYRFKKDKKGWRLFVTIAVQAPSKNTLQGNGVIGVDINVDHLAIVETDRNGNPIWKQTIPLVSYGKTKEQAKAVIGDACAKVVQIARRSKKPLVVERLNFQKKKAELKEESSQK